MEKVTLFLNGKIFTENPAKPWAEALAVKGKKFAFVGTNSQVLAWAEQCAPDCERVDLGGRTVLPGLLDGHTHPTVVASTAWHAIIPYTFDFEELKEYIREANEKYPKEKYPFFYCENYKTEVFGVEGPTKDFLDEIIPDRPAKLQGSSYHCCLYNSVALDMMKDENGVPQVNGGLGGMSVFAQDENGEYTGYAMEVAVDTEFGIFDALDWKPAPGASEEALEPFLGMLKRRGVMGLMDGYTEGDEAMKFFYEQDLAGKLNMYYEATSLAFDLDEGLDYAIAQARKWQENYTSEHVRCNTIKYFVDGINETGESLQTEPFHNDPTGTNYGRANCSEEELTAAILKLNEEGLDLHMHVVGDGTFRMVCNAVEAAQKQLGIEGYGYEDEREAAGFGPGFNIRLTMAHCEMIHPDDEERPAKLGIYINDTPHWHGGCGTEIIMEQVLGERWKNGCNFRPLLNSGCRIDYSSDIYSAFELRDSEPFRSMQVGITRIDPYMPVSFDGGVHPPAEACLTFEEILKGYTIDAAYRMKLADRTGSIEAGKMANMVIMGDDPFTYPAETLGEIRVDSVYFEGSPIE